MKPLPPPLPLSGVILAAGRSLRMGRDKAFLTLADGTTLVSRQAALLRELRVRELFISARPDTDYGVPGAQLLYDGHHDAGPLAGIAAALAASTQPHLLVVAVDLPQLTAPLLLKLHRECACGLGAVPKGPRAFEPLCAVYPNCNDSREAVGEALRGGRFSLQELLRSAVTAGWMRAMPIAEAELAAFANWNSPEDQASLPA